MTIEAPVPFSIHGRFRPLLYTEGRLYGSRGKTVYRRDELRQMHRLCSLGSPLINAMSNIWWVERILRANVQGMFTRTENKVFLVEKGQVHTFEFPTFRRLSTFRIPSGGRPLRIETAPNGWSFFGDYTVNHARDPVSMFASPDGIDWTEIYTFPAGEIRHIHGIVYDPYRKGLWTLTGDDGPEAGIWFSDIEYAGITAVSRGRQECRAVSVIPTPDALLIPTDTPQEPNRISRFDPQSGNFEPIQDLPGSSLCSFRGSDCMLVSTAVERSDVNNDQRVSIYASTDGNRWSCIFRAQRDFRVMKSMRPWFQHPNVVFANSDYRASRIYASAIGVKKLDGKMLSWAVTDIVEYLDSKKNAA